jgi:hypothetical protein
MPLSACSPRSATVKYPPHELVRGGTHHDRVGRGEVLEPAATLGVAPRASRSCRPLPPMSPTTTKPVWMAMRMARRTPFSCSKRPLSDPMASNIRARPAPLAVRHLRGLPASQSRSRARHPVTGQCAPRNARPRLHIQPGRHAPRPGNLRIVPFGELRRAYQVAEHDRQLTPLCPRARNGSTGGEVISWEVILSGPCALVGVGTGVGLASGVAHALQNTAPGGLLARRPSTDATAGHHRHCKTSPQRDSSC